MSAAFRASEVASDAAAAGEQAVCISGIGAISPGAEGWTHIVSQLDMASAPPFEAWAPEQDPPCAGARLGLVRQFSRERFFNERQLRLMDRAMALSCTAVGLALEDAGLELDGNGQGDEVAIMMASMRGELPSLYRFGGPLFREQRGTLNPALFPTIARNISCGQAAIRFGLRGWSSMISAGEISGAHVLARARNLVASGRGEVAVVGAFEALSPISLHHIRNRSRKYGRDARFAALDDEVVPSEGACFFVLENLEHARARGARCYALLEPAVHGYVTASGDAVLDQAVARQTARRAAPHVAIDLLLPGSATHSAEAVLENRLLQPLRQQAQPPQEIRLRRWFGDAGALSSLFQTAVAAQLLHDDSTPAFASRPTTAPFAAALTSTLTDRGAYCVNSLRRLAKRPEAT